MRYFVLMEDTGGLRSIFSGPWVDWDAAQTWGEKYLVEHGGGTFEVVPEALGLMAKMRRAYDRGGDTYSSAEVLGLLRRGVAEIDRLRLIVLTAANNLDVVGAHHYANWCRLSLAEEG